MVGVTVSMSAPSLNQQHDDEREVTYRKKKSAGKERLSDLGLEMDEVQVEEGRTRWALVAQELVGGSLAVGRRRSSSVVEFMES